MVRLRPSANHPGSTYNYISIPYGTIKTHAGVFGRGKVFEFQFLMVRLRQQRLDRMTAQAVHFNSLWYD